MTLTARLSLAQLTGFENSKYGAESKPQTPPRSVQHVACRTPKRAVRRKREALLAARRQRTGGRTHRGRERTDEGAVEWKRRFRDHPEALRLAFVGAIHAKRDRARLSAALRLEHEMLRELGGLDELVERELHVGLGNVPLPVGLEPTSVGRGVSKPKRCAAPSSVPSSARVASETSTSTRVAPGSVAGPSGTKRTAREPTQMKWPGSAGVMRMDGGGTSRSSARSGRLKTTVISLASAAFPSGPANTTRNFESSLLAPGGGAGARTPPGGVGPDPWRTQASASRTPAMKSPERRPRPDRSNSEIQGSLRTGESATSVPVTQGSARSENPGFSLWTVIPVAAERVSADTPGQRRPTRVRACVDSRAESGAPLPAVPARALIVGVKQRVRLTDPSRGCVEQHAPPEREEFGR